MIRPFVTLTAAVALFGCASPAVSQRASTTAPTSSAGAETPPLSPRPFARVFGQQTPPRPSLFRLRTPAPIRGTTPLPTCGLVVVPADPRIDPSFERRPVDDGTRFSMRSMPWLCK